VHYSARVVKSQDARIVAHDVSLYVKSGHYSRDFADRNTRTGQKRIAL
jgi:hypothetical protein